MQVALLRWSNEDWRDAECWVQQVLRVDLREALEAPELKAKPQIGVSSIAICFRSMCFQEYNDYLTVEC